MSGGRIIADVLVAQGVRFLFTLCGGHISPILVGAKDRGIRVIDVRDEATAVFAADAVARLSGVPGVAAVTAGPGATNSITAVKNAQLAQTPVVLLGDRLGNRGPLLYRQRRVGRDGRSFSILKFRTMTAEGDGAPAPDWTVEDDPRITPFGRWMRMTHVDELPQVLNILRGDLAVVGPRPEQPRYVEELSEKLPFYGMRHLVRKRFNCDFDTALEAVYGGEG